MEGCDTMKNEFDVIVVGGGISGACAAIASARQGQDVLLIEKSGFLGGAIGNMYVNPFAPYFMTENGEKININKGIFLEIINELKQMGGLKGNCIFNDEYLKIILDKKAREANVTVLFHSTLCDTNVANKKIKSVRVTSKLGMLEFYGTNFIDASGDANLAASAGCPFTIGREEDSACQPMTLCFRVEGINVEKFYANYDETQRLYKEYQKLGKIKNPRENILTFKHVSDNVIHLNTTRVVGLSPLDPFQISKAEMIAREQMYELFTFLKEKVKGCENATLMCSAPEIGVRESRMIKGKYTITANDILSCRDFEDSIAVGNYSIDIHSPDGSGTVMKHIENGKYYHIPYRSLIPEGIENLLVAGRCISSTHEAQSAYRVIPIVANIGEAAGIAASISNKLKINPEEIPIKILKTSLAENNLLF